MAEIPTASSQVEPQEPIMDLDDEVALEVDDKVELLKGYEPDLSAATFCLHDEDHTLGNALRYMLMKNPSVEFCGYSNPHPSEPKIHLRIQMYGYYDRENEILTNYRKSSLTALREALDNLDQLFETIGDEYAKDLERGEYQRFEEPGLSEEQMRETIAKGEDIRRQQRQEQKATSA